MSNEFSSVFLSTVAAVIADNRIALVELDRAIGDADHGENLDRGFSAVTERVVVGADSTVAEVLRGVATTVVWLEDFGLSVPRVPLVARVDEFVTLALDFHLVASP